MYALPPRLGSSVEPQVTGISCPDCGGVLGVRHEGRNGWLLFECRIGHTLDVPELLSAKEERLEGLLWGANTLLREMVALLLDLSAHGSRHAESPASIRAYVQRALQARANADAVREVLAASRPVDLAAVEPDTDGTGGARPGTQPEPPIP